MTFSLDAIYHGASWAIYSHSKELMELQEKAATGQDINRTSDDPIKSNRVLDLRSDERGLTTYLETLEESVSILDYAGSVVQSISGQVSDAMSSLTSVLSGVWNSQDNNSVRASLSEDVNNILEQIVSLSNSQRLGHRLFSGENTDADAYSVQRDSNGDITRVNYEGSYEERKVEVAPGVDMGVSLVGDELFKSDDRGTTRIFGNTGASVGTGTSNVRGDVWLTVTGVPGNFDLSIDGGTTTVNVNGTETNAAVVNPSTGEVLYIDATTITQAGTDRVQCPGTYDIFNVLINVRDMLKNVSSVDSDDWHTMMDHMIDSLREVEQKLTKAFPTIGGRINSMTNFKDALEDIRANTQDDISRMQDADIAQVSLELSRHEVLYQMSLNVAAKMFSMSLLDFM